MLLVKTPQIESVKSGSLYSGESVPQSIVTPIIRPLYIERRSGDFDAAAVLMICRCSVLLNVLDCIHHTIQELLFQVESNEITTIFASSIALLH